MTGAENCCMKSMDIARDAGQSRDRIGKWIEGKRYYNNGMQLSNDDDVISIYHDRTKTTMIIIDGITNVQRKNP